MNRLAVPSWLEDAVFYEIYPQSFYDSNGDGIGDIPGIIARLDYVQALGVTAIWLNPWYESPFQDAGYDVSDYYKVAPRYGTNEDARRLFAEARQRGLRILVDLVPGHTSIAHPWFQASCQPGRNDYSDWYIWTDSAWKWDVPGLRVISGFADRDGAYITNFFYSQPALNYGFAHPDPKHPWQQPVDAPGPQAVRAEMRRVMQFWLEMGASGFRVDMAGWCVKADPDYRANIALWQDMRAWLEDYDPQAVLVSEWGRPTLAIQGGFHIDFLLPFGSPGYTSLLRKPVGEGGGSDRYGCAFFDRRGCGNIQEFIDDYLPHYNAVKDHGLIAPITGNHDINPRLANGRSAEELKLVFLWLLTMPGTPFIYYGDEIGMHTLPGLHSREGGYARTGSRTPMQWTDGPNAGFSSAPAESLYLPVDTAPGRVSVGAQEADPTSLLQHVRRLIALRRAYPALHAGSQFEVLYAEAFRTPFVYQRRKNDQTILVAINPSEQPVEIVLPAGLTGSHPQTLVGEENVFKQNAQGWALSLPGISGGLYLV